MGTSCSLKGGLDLTCSDNPPSSPFLSPVAIGILVIGIVSAVVIVGVGVIYWRNKKYHKEKRVKAYVKLSPMNSDL